MIGGDDGDEVDAEDDDDDDDDKPTMGRDLLDCDKKRQIRAEEEEEVRRDLWKREDMRENEEEEKTRRAPEDAMAGISSSFLSASHR
mgnify:FL=1